MNTTNNPPQPPREGVNSWGFIVPFLNDATWLSCFLEHYRPILATNPKNKMVFVEGATSFHSASEHRTGFSLDGSNEIIKRLKTDQIIHIRKGKVGALAELMNEGYVHCNRQDYVIPLFASTFISEEFFQQHSRSRVDLIHLNEIELIRDFMHFSSSRHLFAFQNIEGLVWRLNELIPFWENVRLDEIGKVIKSDAQAVSVEKIETQYQFLQRTSRKKHYVKWYQKAIDAKVVWDETCIEREKAQRNNGGLYLGYLPTALQSHEWYEKDAEAIWKYHIVFPRFETHHALEATTTKKILEIGCATGQTLLYYQERGWRAIGIEPSLWASGYGRHILGVDVRTGVVDDFSFPDGEFSVIAFWDSFEHVPNPIETLQHIRSWLANDGKLMIYTPDVSKWGDDKRHFLWSPRQHYFLYTPETLKGMLEKTGFRVISTDRKIDNHGFLMVAQKGKT
jgi:SAM-dependent methyltransferase